MRRRVQISTTIKRIGVAGLFLAEFALMAAIAYGGGELPIDGVMVGDEDVIIEVRDQAAFGAISIDRIMTPVDGWVILRADRDGEPGELIGAAAVSKGENRNVGVVFERRRGHPEAAFVSLVADKGTRGEFEYTTGDPLDFVSLDAEGMGSAMGGPGAASDMGAPMDKPLVAAGEVPTKYVRITPFNVVYRVPEANIGAAFLDASGTAVDVQRVDAPADSWVLIVRGSAAGEASEVLGSALVPAGATADLKIQLSEAPGSPKLTALLLADLGAPGVLETDPVGPSRGVDAPYLVLSYFVQIAVIAP